MSLEQTSGEGFNITTVFNEGLINNLFIGICVLDLNQTIRYWSKGAENITGYKAEDLRGQNFFNRIKLFNEEDQYLMPFQSPVTIALENKILLDERLFMSDNKSQKLCIRLQAIPTMNDEGILTGEMVIFVPDFAYFEQKKLSEDLKTLNEKKNHFLGMAAHDLRNPLNVIKGFTSLLLNLERKDIKPDHLSMLELIDKNCKQMLVIVNDLLDLTAIEEGKIELNKQPSDIREILEVDNYYASILASKKNIDISLNIQNEIPKANLDKERLIQVFENLLNNAVKFSEPHTKIVLSVTYKDNSINISVKDEGKGIPKEDLDNIFKPFETPVSPTGKEKSTGLGLVIVKKIINLHQGDITVNSMPGRGTEFIISLPAN